MIEVEAIAQVTYICELTSEDEIKVRFYAEENNIDIEEAIKDLWENGEINIYAGEQTESDACTESVSLYNECS